MRGLGEGLGRWRKSSYSNNANACVETVLWQDGGIGVRDSTHPDDSALGFRANEWTALLGHMRVG